MPRERRHSGRGCGPPPCRSGCSEAAASPLSSPSRVPLQLQTCGWPQDFAYWDSAQRLACFSG
eukprot:6980087-Heterocapsa_arctica.AAC.1